MEKEGMLGAIFMFIGSMIIMSNVTITGAVIGSGNVNYVSIVGLLTFVLGGVLVGMSGNSNYLQRTDPKYFIRRANELTRNGIDSWISLYETNGVLNELADKGYEIEHGDSMVSFPLSGKPPHVTIQEGGKGLRKHLFITNDPQDLRLKFRDMGRSAYSGYNPKHARNSGNEKTNYLNQIKIEGKG